MPSDMEKFAESELILNEDGSVYHLHLLPDDIADTLILVGDPDRVEKVSRHFDRVELRKHKREFVTHTGYIGGKRLSVLSSGIGPDNVEIVLTELDALANIDLHTRERKSSHKVLQMVRIGTSGAMQAHMAPGSHLASASALGLDNLLHFYQLPQSEEQAQLCQAVQAHVALPWTPYTAPAADALLQMLGKDMFTGCTVTSPGFYAPQGRQLLAPVRFQGLMDRLAAFEHQGAPFFTNFEMETSAYYAMSQLLGHHFLSLNAIVANRATKQFDPDAEQTVERLIIATLERLVEI